jgi:hypothetical protein
MEGGSNAMLSLKGYMIDAEHIHIDTQMLSIASCQVTIMVIDLSKLAEKQIKMVHLSLADAPSQNSLTLPNM